MPAGPEVSLHAHVLTREGACLTSRPRKSCYHGVLHSFKTSNKPPRRARHVCAVDDNSHSELTNDTPTADKGTCCETMEQAVTGWLSCDKIKMTSATQAQWKRSANVPPKPTSTACQRASCSCCQTEDFSWLAWVACL